MKIADRGGRTTTNARILRWRGSERQEAERRRGAGGARPHKPLPGCRSGCPSRDGCTVTYSCPAKTPRLGGMAKKIPPHRHAPRSPILKPSAAGVQAALGPFSRDRFPGSGEGTVHVAAGNATAEKRTNLNNADASASVSDAYGDSTFGCQVGILPTPPSATNPSGISLRAGDMW